ncbi:hypothetical protein T02_5975 [Trichinella nativa]|uniref:Uncharacterized protein n=1 Tax=Trichinella nativa TaxID=6335 RepID=A0A0V1K7R0_9BILA|nr:hypothetical protein T02_5975 [Trichinella nativa]
MVTPMCCHCSPVCCHLLHCVVTVLQFVSQCCIVV